jgi:hypothetical protein
MIYRIYLQNGGTPWLAFQTTDETQANAFVKKSTALYIYVYSFDDRDILFTVECHKTQRNGL